MNKNNLIPGCWPAGLQGCRGRHCGEGAVHTRQTHRTYTLMIRINCPSRFMLQSQLMLANIPVMDKCCTLLSVSVRTGACLAGPRRRVYPSLKWGVKSSKSAQL